MEAITRAARIRDRKRRTGFNREQTRSRDERPGAGCENCRSRTRFGLLMQRHSLRKEYLAIVWGWPEWEHKLVDAPLDRQGKHQDSVIWLKQMIHVAGAPAQTEFFVERRFRRSTLVGRSVQRHSRDSAHRTHSSDSGASRLNRPPNRWR